MILRWFDKSQYHYFSYAPCIWYFAVNRHTHMHLGIIPCFEWFGNDRFCNAQQCINTTDDHFHLTFHENESDSNQWTILRMFNNQLHPSSARKHESSSNEWEATIFLILNLFCHFWPRFRHHTTITICSWFKNLVIRKLYYSKYVATLSAPVFEMVIPNPLLLIRSSRVCYFALYFVIQRINGTRPRSQIGIMKSL